MDINKLKIPLWSEFLLLPPQDCTTFEDHQLIVHPRTGYTLFLLRGATESYLYKSDKVQQQNGRLRLIRLGPALNVKLLKGVVHPHNDTILFLSLASTSPFSDFRYTTYIFNTTNETWAELNTTGIAPKQRKNPVTVLFNNNLYIFGGTSMYTSDLSINFVHKLDLSTFEWTSQEYFEKDNEMFEEVKTSNNNNFRIGEPAVLVDEWIYFFRELSTGSKSYVRSASNNNIISDTKNKELTRYNIVEKRVEKISLEPFATFTADAKLVSEDKSIYIFDDNTILKFDLLTKELRKLDGGIIMSDVNVKQCSVAIAQKEFFLLGRSKEGLLLLSLEESLLAIKRINDPSTTLHDYYNKVAFSDIMFKCDKNELYCNKRVLSRYAKNLYKLIPENEISLVKISDVNFDTFSKMIEHLYHNMKNPLNADNNIYQEIILIANRFGIDDLQTLCENVLTYSLITPALVIDDSNIGLLLNIVRNLQTFTLKQKCIDYLITNFKALSERKVISVTDLSIIFDYLKAQECLHETQLSIDGPLRDIINIGQESKDQQSQSKESKNLMTVPKFYEIKGVTSDGNLAMKICTKCHKVINFDDLKYSNPNTKTPTNNNNPTSIIDIPAPVTISNNNQITS